MWTPSDRAPKFSGKRSFRLAATLLVVVSVVASAAPAPQPAANPPTSAAERADLRRVLDSRYEVLPVSGGIALKPRQPRAGIRSIEVSDEGVAVNGERVSSRTLRDWLGEDADGILRLQGLSATDQRQIFGLEDGAAVPEASGEPQAATGQGEEGEDADVAEEPVPPESPLPPATPQPPRIHRSTGSRVNVGGSVKVERNEIVEQAVAVGGSATVDGEVEDGVVAIGGPARVQGRVGGEVVSVGGSVYLGPKAVVEGDVTSVGGVVHRDPGSVVHGDTNEVSILPFGRLGRDHGWWGDWDLFRFGPWTFWGGVSDLMSSLMFMVLLGLLVCLVVAVARRPLERVDRQLENQLWPSAAVGLAGFIFFWPLLVVLTIVLAITIVGCLLYVLYPFLFLYVFLLYLLGYSAVAYRLGRWLESRFSRRFGGPYAAALLGVVALQIWTVMAKLLDLLPGAGIFSFTTGLFGILVQLSAWIVGFGAVLLSGYGSVHLRVNTGGNPAGRYDPPPQDHLPLTDSLSVPASEPRWEEPESSPPR